MPQAPTRIVIVDDHALLAESLGAWIIQHPDLALVGRRTAWRAGSFAWPCSLIWRWWMLTCPTGRLELVKRLRVKMPALRLLTMTGRMIPTPSGARPKAASTATWKKTLPPEILLEAIRTVAKGGVFFSPLFQK